MKWSKIIVIIIIIITASSLNERIARQIYMNIQQSTFTPNYTCLSAHVHWSSPPAQKWLWIYRSYILFKNVTKQIYGSHVDWRLCFSQLPTPSNYYRLQSCLDWHKFRANVCAYLPNGTFKWWTHTHTQTQKHTHTHTCARACYGQ
jgi:thiosulfate reductase cytochrome b subunit